MPASVVRHTVSDTSAQATLTRQWDANSIYIEVLKKKNSQPGHVVFLQRLSPGWHAALSGRQTPGSWPELESGMIVKKRPRT